MLFHTFHKHTQLFYDGLRHCISLSNTCHHPPELKKEFVQMCCRILHIHTGFSHRPTACFSCPPMNYHNTPLNNTYPARFLSRMDIQKTRCHNNCKLVRFLPSTNTSPVMHILKSYAGRRSGKPLFRSYPSQQIVIDARLFISIVSLLAVIEHH